MKKKQQTNVSVIKSIMEYGNPMKQVWIMTTLQEAAKQQAFAPAPNWGDTAFISGEAWKAAAQEVYAELKEAGYGKGA